MAGSYNRLVVVGNLTRPPEIRYVDGGGKSVTKFTLAINRKTKGGEEVLYLDIVAWDRLGEIANQYLNKGASALVEGRLVIRDYTNKDGEKRRATECVASAIQMLDSKRDADERRGGAAAAPSGGASSGGGYRSTDGGGYGGGADDFDDEIPF